MIQVMHRARKAIYIGIIQALVFRPELRSADRALLAGL